MMNPPARTLQPLRVALVSEHASPLATMGGVDAGGQNVYVAHVAKGLAALGHQVEVFTRRDDPTLPAVVDLRPGVRVRHVTAGPAAFVPKEQLLPHMPAFAAGLERMLRSVAACDVVHANFFMSGLASLRLKSNMGLPLVTTFHALGLVRREHQQSADAFPPQRIDIERMLVERSDRVIAECPQDREDLSRLYGASHSRMRMVPCGIDPTEFRPMDQAAARAELGLDPDEFIVLQLGRLVPRKGVDNVIRSLAFLPDRAKVRLVIVGGDSREPDEARTPEIARLRRVAQEAGVAERVLFTGQRRRDELRAYFSAADVFVSTPWYEPFGITPLEAMACGTPVIGSAVGGIAYSVADGVTGFLVPPKDPAALALRLAQLQAQPALGRALGLAGVKRVRSMFTWDHVAAQLADVYDEVCDPLAVLQTLPARSRPLRLVSSRPMSPRLGVSLVH